MANQKDKYEWNRSRSKWNRLSLQAEVNKVQSYVDHLKAMLESGLLTTEYSVQIHKDSLARLERELTWIQPCLKLAIEEDMKWNSKE
jgi:hypothetical protein